MRVQVCTVIVINREITTITVSQAQEWVRQSSITRSTALKVKLVGMASRQSDAKPIRVTRCLNIAGGRTTNAHGSARTRIRSVVIGSTATKGSVIIDKIGRVNPSARLRRR